MPALRSAADPRGWHGLNKGGMWVWEEDLLEDAPRASRPRQGIHPGRGQT